MKKRRIPYWGKSIILTLLTGFLASCTGLFRIWPPGTTLDIREDCAKHGARLEPQFDRYKFDNNLYYISVHCNAADDIIPVWVNVVYIFLMAVTIISALFMLYYVYCTLRSLTDGRKTL